MSWQRYLVDGSDSEGEDTSALVLQSESDSVGYEAVTVCVPAEMPPVVPVTGESFCQCPAPTELSSDLHTLSCSCGEEEQGCDWVWDEEVKSSSVSLSCSNQTVSFHSEFSCGTAAIRGTKALSDGQHFWEIKMTSPVYGTDMMVGIGTSEVNLDQFKHSFCSLLGTDEDSWGLSYTGQLHHKGSKVSFSSRFGQGSIIGVHLDGWHGTLSFYKNRRCIGVAATHLQNKHFYPMVCSTAAKSSMKLIRSHSAATSLQFLCCSRLRQFLPTSVDALPPGLRTLLSNQLGWVLALGGTDTPEANFKDQSTQTEVQQPDAGQVFISSSFSYNPDSFSLHPDDSQQLDSTCFLEHPSELCRGFTADLQILPVSFQNEPLLPDSVSFYPDEAYNQDDTCYRNPPSSPSDINCLVPDYKSASCDPPLTVPPDVHKVIEPSSTYKPERTSSCILSPALSRPGHTHTPFWSDSASESESDEFSSDLEMYQRKRCRWT
ncbi:hypothetical protein DNTS_028339 [Danionella cerebrum]|uniref:SPRY domain-containing SOCS box protein 3 n=1 Tax=Danionella cerebrum TaxID=2873325 RepID=A0A553R1T1_9TELE|nr:hypothetical protein DNTS_028339 [Danionella translucida]